MYEFEFRTGKVVIDRSKCEGCSTYACVKACSLYGRGVLSVRGGKPALAIERSETARLCIECLACEQDCWLEGKGAIRITLPIPGLEEYRKRVGLSWDLS